MNVMHTTEYTRGSTLSLGPLGVSLDLSPPKPDTARGFVKCMFVESEVCA